MSNFILCSKYNKHMFYIKLSGIVSMYNILQQNEQKGGIQNNYRKIVVTGSTQELNKFKNYIKKFTKDLEERNVKIIYNKGPNFLIKLYGYDGELKKSIDKQDLDVIIDEIDQMPMGKLEKSLREKFLIE